MLQRVLPVPQPFHFLDVVKSHGWYHLPPFAWEPETETLSRVDLSGERAPVVTRLSATEGGVLVTTEDDPHRAEARVRWTLALDEDLSGFHALCLTEPRLARAAERGQGRMLRSPSVWEDLVKTLFSVNTTWRQTVSMTRNLVTRYGVEHPGGARTFPGPEAVAALEPEALQQHCRMGYRAGVLSGLARAVSEGRLDLEGLQVPGLATAEVESRLLSVKGIGPYAAGNVLMLLGHYDHLPVDSWFRTTVRNGWFGGQVTSEREMVAAFDRYRPYRTLVYHFYDWSGSESAVMGIEPPE